MHFLKLIQKILGFVKKQAMEKKNEWRCMECFPLLQFLTSNGVDFFRGMKSIFEEHLSQLITWFEKYFQNDNVDKLT